MDFQDLHAFVHVAREESFSKAAAKLRVAQSALSRRIGRLEHMLGTPLLMRHARGARPTEAGMVLLNRAEDLMRGLDDIERDLLSLAKEPTGLVNIALPPTAGEVIAPLIMERCRRRFPGITITLREGFSGTIHEWLVTGQVDLALLYDPEHSSELYITPILDEPLYLVVPTQSQHEEELARSLAIDPATGTRYLKARNLRDLPLILPGRTHSIRLMLERYAANHSFQLRVVNEVDGTRLIRALVQADFGYTVFSYAGVYEGLLAGKLQTIPIMPPMFWQLALAHKKIAASSVVLNAVKSVIIELIDVFVEKGFWHGQLATRDASRAISAPPSRFQEMVQSL